MVGNPRPVVKEAAYHDNAAKAALPLGYTEAEFRRRVLIDELIRDEKPEVSRSANIRHGLGPRQTKIGTAARLERMLLVLASAHRCRSRRGWCAACLPLGRRTGRRDYVRSALGFGIHENERSSMSLHD